MSLETQTMTGTTNNHAQARGKQTPAKHAHLDAEQLEAFGAELDAIRNRVWKELGDKDARHIRRVVSVQRASETGGRTLLFAGFLPPAWMAGTSLLTLSRVLENMEIGHNVLHGQYDWMNDPKLHSTRYEWDWACPAKHWQYSHNYIHHTYTNVVGKDRDVGYGLLRMAEDQPWHWFNVPQPLYALWQMFFFQSAVAVHDLELDYFMSGHRSLRWVAKHTKPILRKVVPQFAKDYILFPVLAGPSAPFVIAGNLTANTARNVWAFLVIFCGHFPDGVEMYRPEDLEDETRGRWYLRQVRGSANVEGSRLFDILSGHLSYQIEHHLFPDLPSSRYAEIAPEVEAVCRKYGVKYNKARFSRQVKTALGRVARHALPPRRRGRAPAAAA